MAKKTTVQPLPQESAEIRAIQARIAAVYHGTEAGDLAALVRDMQALRAAEVAK